MGKVLFRAVLVLTVLVAVFLVIPAVWAAAPPRSESRLDRLLSEWAKANDRIRSMTYQFTQTEIDASFGTRVVKKGNVQVLKSDLLRVDWHTSPEPTVLLMSRHAIHCFDPERKAELIWKKPSDGSFLGEMKPTRSFWESLARIGEEHLHWTYWIFSGLPVRDLNRRCEVRLVKEDRHYFYLAIQPRTGQGAIDFSKMRVVLLRDTFHVRQICTECSNGYRTVLDFGKLDTKAKVTSTTIRSNLPQHWDRIDPVEKFKALENE